MTLPEMARQISERSGVSYPLVLAQMQHESANGSSELAIEDHNYTGITAADGMKFAGNTAYAHFDTDEEYVDYFSWLLPRFNVVGITDPREYAQTLHDNGYYTDSVDNYYNGMMSFIGEMPSNPLGYFGNLLGQNNVNYGTTFKQPETPDVPQESYDNSIWGSVKQIAGNFMDSIKHTGFAEVVHSLWNRHSYGTGFFGGKEALTQADVDFTQTALPEDKELQKWCLLHASNSEELRHIVTEKQEELKERRDFENWRENRANAVEKALSYVAGGVGTLIDPLLLVPVGGELKGVQIATRLGEVAVNAGKVRQVATAIANSKARQYFMKTGIQNAALTVGDMKAREVAGGQRFSDSEYAFAVGGAFVASGLMSYFKHRGTPNVLAAQNAENSLTRSLNTIADYDPRSETISIIREKELHDTNYGKVVNSKFYNQLEKAGKVVAMKSEDATKLVKELSGIDVPKEAKAFYVPNEDYTIILTDRVDPKKINKVLAHESLIHSGLRKTLKEEDYKKLLSYIDEKSNDRGHALYKARQASNAYDPEETLAYALEHDLLPSDVLKKMSKMINKGFKGMGFKVSLSNSEVLEALRKNALTPHLGAGEIHINSDGSTAFMGIKFSRDNPMNPVNLLEDTMSPEEVLKISQKDMPSMLRNITKKIDMGIYGLAVNSTSPTVRKFFGKMFNDPRNRGLTDYGELGMSAETYKKRMVQQMSMPLFDYVNLRMNYLLKNGADKRWRIWGERANTYFNDLAIRRYNTKYGGNTTEPLKEVPKEIEEAADKLHEFYTNAEQLMKSSKNSLMSDDWQALDGEFTRRSNMQRIQDFIGHFNTAKEAREALTQYFHDAITPEKFEVARSKIQRDRIAENKKLMAENDNIEKWNMEHPEETPKKLKELKETEVSDSDVQAYYNKAIPYMVKRMLSDNIGSSGEMALGELGDLRFLKQRVPIDTSFVKTMVRKDGTSFEFSFDNNLRSYDVDNILMSYIQRASGEQALMQIVKSPKDLEAKMARIEKELTLSLNTGAISKSEYEYQLKNIKNAINEFRGLPAADEEALSKPMAGLKILRNLTYAAKGGLMGVNQLAEIGSTVAYGGLAQVFHAIPWLGKTIDNYRWGKVSAETARETVNQVFCAEAEKQIWSMNVCDYEVRRALTKKNDMGGKGLMWAADASLALGKITSTVNMLPRMTDWMTRGIKAQTIMDTVMWAHGKNFSKLRNPFSASKLKAGHISAGQAEKIKDSIRKYTKVNDKGEITQIDHKTWYAEEPTTFNQWYNLVTNQAERGLVVATRQGNKNLLKSQSQLTQLAFQFKDFSLRALNAQTMRALTERDVDDALAAIGSIMANSLVWCARGALAVSAANAFSKPEDIKKVRERYFSPEKILYAGVARSTIMGTPLGFLNDFAEPLAGWSTIRTSAGQTFGKGVPRSVGELAGNIVEQIPSMSYMSGGFRLYNQLKKNHADDNGITSRDLAAFVGLLPFPNNPYITAFLNSIAKNK